MAQDNSKVYFKELTKDEKLSKLFQLNRQARPEIIFWEKGSTKKDKILVETYLRDHNRLETSNISIDNLDANFLFSFILNGVHYFGSCKVKKHDKGYSLIPNDPLYQSERRSNFRLLTYPHQEVYAYIKFNVEKIEESNLFQFNTGLSETNLFKNFLKVVDEEVELEEQGYIKLRVIDISVTGLALQMGIHEKDLFEKERMEIDKIKLDFNNQIIDIPNCKIHYFLDFLANDRKTKMYKAGVEFLDIDTNLDEKLSHIINKTLRSIEDEFEDFYK